MKNVIPRKGPGMQGFYVLFAVSLTSSWTKSPIFDDLRFETLKRSCVVTAMRCWGIYEKCNDAAWVWYQYSFSILQPSQLIFLIPLLHRLSLGKVRIGLSQQQSGNSVDYTHLSAVQCGVRTARGQDYVVQMGHSHSVKAPQVTNQPLLTTCINCITDRGTCK